MIYPAIKKSEFHPAPSHKYSPTAWLSGMNGRYGFPVGLIPQKEGAGIYNQSGITLLLALLVLSTIMAIVISIATILLAEVRVSGDLLRTEPAIYGANAVTEEALFMVRRNYPRCPATQVCANQFSYTTQLGAVKMDNPPPLENLYNDSIVQDKVLITSNSIANTHNKYTLYDPTDINSPGNYVQLKVTYKDTGVGGRIHVYICQFKAPRDFLPTDPPIDCNTPTSSDMIYQDSVPLNQGQAIPLITLDPNKQQELIIYSSDSPTGDQFVQIEAFGPDGPDADTNPDPKGMPFYGETVVDINARNGGVTRALRVKIPHN